MGKLLKGLFNNSNSNNIAKNKEDDGASFKEFVLVDWYDEGKEKAQKHGGSEAGLKTSIGKIFHNHRELLRKDQNEQEEAKKPYRIKLQEYTKKNEFYTNRINKIKNEDIPKIKEKIGKVQEEINEIKNNPQHYIGDKVGKASFVIGTIILTFLTIYLFIFYSSASYSAFFKEFSLNELGVANSIFDPKALNKALKDGFTELILILTIPFVFLGLGYLIHKFQEGKSWKKYPKIVMLIIVTFVFDCILAYEITEKIYNIKAQNSFQDIPEYTTTMAFQSVNFWLIIFAGFVVYIIWGFVFDFVMESYGKLDQIKILLNTKRDDILNHEKSISEHEEEINKMNYVIGQNNTEIKKLDTILEHSNVIKPKELEHSIMRFLDGWLEYLNFNNSSESIKDNAHNIAINFIEINIKSLQIENNEK